MVDNEWGGLLDTLMQPAAIDQNDDADAQDASSWQELIDQLAVPEVSLQSEELSQLELGHVRQHKPEQLVVSENMYGKASDLEHIGSYLQQRMFSAFRTTVSCARGWRTDNNRTREDIYAEQYVRSSQRLMSRVCESESTGIPAATISRGLLQYAAALVYGTMFLVGAFWSAWCNMFRHKRYVPIAVISKFKYDETPLRLKVKEFNDFLQVNFVGVSSAPDAISEQYLHAKIMRVQWNYRRRVSIQFMFLWAGAFGFTQTLMLLVS